MSGMNVPCRIGRAVCLPGDVVFGTSSGVMFIPPQLAEAVVVYAEKSKVKDIFGFIRLREGVYTTARIDMAWDMELVNDFLGWFKSDPQAGPYRHLTWEDEIKRAESLRAGQSIQAFDV